MKVRIEGRVIGAEKTQKGKNIIQVLSNPHPQTKAQDVYKVFTNNEHKVGEEYKGEVRANVDLWFEG